MDSRALSLKKALTKAPRGFWDIRVNQRKALDDFASKYQLNSVEDWSALKFVHKFET